MKHIFLFFLLSFSFLCNGQNVIEYKNEQINVIDENGKQTGIWKLYDDDKKIMITTEFKNGEIISDTKYYYDSKLIASYKGNDLIEIYKDGKTIKGYFFRKENGGQTIVDNKGKELEVETLRYFYLSGQVMPMYYGGQALLFDFIGKNIDYKSIKDNKGKVKIKFVIDTVGKTSQIEIVESTNKELNEEAKRIVQNLPRWQPAHQGGAFVRCPYIIPITIN